MLIVSASSKITRLHFLNILTVSLYKVCLTRTMRGNSTDRDDDLAAAAFMAIATAAANAASSLAAAATAACLAAASATFLSFLSCLAFLACSFSAFFQLV